jgi:hypothetical protein
MRARQNDKAHGMTKAENPSASRRIFDRVGF